MCPALAKLSNIPLLLAAMHVQKLINSQNEEAQGKPTLFTIMQWQPHESELEVLWHFS